MQNRNCFMHKTENSLCKTLYSNFLIYVIIRCCNNRVIGKNTLRPSWAMVNGVFCVLSPAFLCVCWGLRVGAGETDQLLIEFKVLFKYFLPQQGRKRLQKANYSFLTHFQVLEEQRAIPASSLIWPLSCDVSIFCMCLYLSVWSLALKSHLRQKSPIGCHHSCMTRAWQEDCMHSVLPGFAYIQSNVVACQTKWKGICIVVSMLVPFICPLPLQSHTLTQQYSELFQSEDLTLLFKLTIKTDVTKPALVWKWLKNATLKKMLCDMYFCIHFLLSLDIETYFKWF